MKKVLIASLIAISAIGAQAHDYHGYQPQYNGGSQAGNIIGGMILGAVIDRAISQHQYQYQQPQYQQPQYQQPQVGYQQPQLVYQTPGYTQPYPVTRTCTAAYDAYGRLLGCMR
jgi:hypothetical protein